MEMSVWHYRFPAILQRTCKTRFVALDRGSFHANIITNMMDQKKSRKTRGRRITSLIMTRTRTWGEVETPLLNCPRTMTSSDAPMLFAELFWVNFTIMREDIEAIV